MSDVELVLREQRGELTLLTLNRPERRNAMSLDLVIALRDALRDCMNDSQCRGIIVSGAGDHFCSGGDISGMTEERSIAESRRRMGIFHELARVIVAGAKPVIAAVDGYAAGAGFSLALAADYLVASDNAKFVCSFSRVGLQPDLGLLWTIRQRVGLGQAKRIIASARKVQVGEALELGLVDEVVAPEKLLDRAAEVCGEFTAGAPLPLAVMKQAYAWGIDTFEDALRNEMDNSPGLYLTRDHRAAVTAFLEKRTPEFRGE